jgi:hypothetical protein
MTSPFDETALPELAQIRRLIEPANPHLQARVLCEITTGGQRLPVHAIALGNPDPALPAIGFFGGVHGLERIGTQVLIAYLQSLCARLPWDRLLHQQLDQLRMVFVPLINPGGFLRRTRANPAGVDLMRNAPIDADESPPFLLGGQRLSRNLPWYRGPDSAPMQAESAALCALVEAELLPRQFSLAIDCHSGFGLADRVWFPYAHTRRPMRHLPEVLALSEILDNAHVHHRYVVEPQSRQYLTHGDIWDHLHVHAPHVFIPLTLEMGSWLWVKKNPSQLFSRQGMFNPMVEHRQQRVLRRHAAWLDFMARAAASHALWQPHGDARDVAEQRALARWYSPPERR